MLVRVSDNSLRYLLALVFWTYNWAGTTSVNQNKIAWLVHSQFKNFSDSRALKYSYRHEGSKSRGEIYTKHHSHFSPAGAESDSKPTAPAPSQTEVTNLNCSDHSTTSKEMVAWRALVRIHLTRTQDPTPRYRWMSDGRYLLYRSEEGSEGTPSTPQCTTSIP